MSARSLVCGRFTLSLERPLVMGIVNITPDSFSDGGRYLATEAAVAHARKLIEDGADIIDLGGESTRPGAPVVGLQEEADRVLPVLEALAQGAVPVSVDTQKPELMREAIRMGASLINDVNALQAEGALEACAAARVAVCLMHKQGTPQTMQQDPRYADVVGEVRDFLLARAVACEQVGIAPGRIILDPGFGFGKTSQHNFTLLREFSVLAESGYATLAGYSRKRSLGEITGRGPEERLAASLAAALIAAQNGADIVRVHDVRETVDVLRIWHAAR